MKSSSYKKGLLAEYLVMFYYRICCYKILAHRLRNIAGEIDIIAKNRDTVVFIEVKARKFDYHDPSIVTPTQRKRIIRAAKIFLSKNDFNNYDKRLDLVIVKKFGMINIIKNAWYE